MDKEIESMTYEQALGELEGILSALRSDTCGIDTLAERARRAADLLKYCQGKLVRTEEELAKVLGELDANISQ